MKKKSTRQVSAHRLTHIASELEKRTGNKAAVGEALEVAGLSDSDLGREGHFIDGHKEADFLNASIAILKDPSFATTTGLGFVNNTSIVVYIGKYSPDLRSAIKNGEKYSTLVDRTSRLRLEISSNAAGLELICDDAYLRRQHRHREFMLFTTLTAIRLGTGRNFHPLEIRFQHPASSSKVEIGKLAGCAVIYECEETEIVLAPSMLDLPIPTYDPSLLHYLKGYADGSLQKIEAEHPDIRTQVESLLVDHLPGRLLPAAEVAAILGMGPRTLTRRLAEADMSYSSIVDELRHDLAKTYLTHSRAPISEIAFLLNYADQAGFTTAFRRWTGRTPNAFRQHARVN